MKRLTCTFALAGCLTVGAAIAAWHFGANSRASAASVDVKGGAAVGAVTFTRDIAPIVFANCVSCHRPGEVAPFALTNYREVRKHASQIADVTEQRFMPPWKPEAGHGDFIGARLLTEPQIKLIREWVKGGAPEGNPAELPALPKFTDGWSLGEPDLIVKMPEAYTLKAEGRDVFRCFVVALGLTEDKYVTAAEFRPSNRKIVHHVLFFLDNSGQARRLDEQDPGPGYSRAGGVGFIPTGGLGGWSPGVTPRHLPGGVARPVKAGADLILQVHFHPSGKVEQEQASVGIYFSKEAKPRTLQSFMHLSGPINIKPGDSHYTVDGSFVTPGNVTLIGVTPHAHLVCKEIKVDATFPSGEQKPLIWIKDWDWNWQDQYLYKEPMKIPAGTKVTCHYVYDNSADNVRNPNNPPKSVHWGEQTADEMAITFFNFLSDDGQRMGNRGLRGFLGGGRRAGSATSTTRPSAR